MPSTNSYLDAAREYADGVRVLFAPVGAPTGERGGVGPVSPQDLAAQAEKLLEVSAKVTVEAENRLATETEDAAKAQTSTQLLAKAVTDLEISSHLLNAAGDEEGKIAWTKSSGTARSVSSRQNIEELLGIMVEESAPTPKVTSRGVSSVGKREAQQLLTQSVEGTLFLISTRVGKTGQSAFAGLLGIGVGEVGKAAGYVGMNLATALGQAEKLSWLYKLVRDFAVRAYDSVVALLGPTLSQIAGKKVMEWIDEIKEAKFFSGQVEKYYQIAQTQDALTKLIASSEAEDAKFLDASQKVDQLGEQFGKQLAVIDKLLTGLRYFGGIPAAMLPSGPLLLAGVYIALCGYVVFAGADYVDAPQYQLLHRVSGVREVVETNLGA
jgi:hypothetical protein